MSLCFEQQVKDKTDMYCVFEVKEQLQRALFKAVTQIPALQDVCQEEIILEVPREKQNGDYASSCAMKFAKLAKMPPVKLAQMILSHADFTRTFVENVTVAAPGFINFTLSSARYYQEMKRILTMRETYGSNVEPQKRKINVEFVSANPTGPVHIGNARGGAIGDVLASVLSFAGNTVEREFYLNDAGNQIEKFKISLYERYKQCTSQPYHISEEMYQGEDILALAQAFAQTHTQTDFADVEALRQALLSFGLQQNITTMMRSLEAYGIQYDTVFSERTLHETGQVREVIAMMERLGATYEKDGALWFKATAYGLEKDEVLLRANGVATYYAADIAYHYNKLVVRGFDLSIDVWGADHHGHVARVKKALCALGVDEERLKVVLMQLVHLVRGKEAVRLSKRKGQIVTLGELVGEVGVSGTRFVFNSTNPNTHMDFDLELAKKKSNENPVFYVQYAHARICSILAHAEKEEGLEGLEVLDSPEEIALLDRLSRFPEEILLCARELDPSRMTKYALSLAGDFHTFYNARRVLVEDQTVKNARLALVRCVKLVLHTTLSLLGVDAPETM